MFSWIATKARRVFAVVHFGLLILRWCGFRMFITKTLHQLYGRTVFLVTTGQLDNPLPPSDFKCTVKLASPNDVKELFSGIHTESPEGRYQLLVRKWYHERGYGDCYVTRTDDTNEICHVRWVVTAKHVRQTGWEDRFPLDEDEAMAENQYTFERFRRGGGRRATALQLREIVRQLGYTHSRGYTDVTNIEQRRHGENISAMVRARILERHFLFRVTHKTLEQYDPPVPMITLRDIK
ncbi:MAG: hypothetical protein JSV77_08895 [Dehalococcoidales bacterium]|nr:MAG: hypothetical protein JSV77_08895 [Dehalococcoidales bacterium]